MRISVRLVVLIILFCTINSSASLTGDLNGDRVVDILKKRLVVVDVPAGHAIELPVQPFYVQDGSDNQTYEKDAECKPGHGAG